MLLFAFFICTVAVTCYNKYLTASVKYLEDATFLENGLSTILELTVSDRLGRVAHKIYLCLLVKCGCGISYFKVLLGKTSICVLVWLLVKPRRHKINKLFWMLHICEVCFCLFFCNGGLSLYHVHTVFGFVNQLKNISCASHLESLAFLVRKKIHIYIYINYAQCEDLPVIYANEFLIMRSKVDAWVRLWMTMATKIEVKRWLAVKEWKWKDSLKEHGFVSRAEAFSHREQLLVCLSAFWSSSEGKLGYWGQNES